MVKYISYEVFYAIIKHARQKPFNTKLLVLQQGFRGITFLSLKSQFEKH